MQRNRFLLAAGILLTGLFSFQLFPVYAASWGDGGSFHYTPSNVFFT